MERGRGERDARNSVTAREWELALPSEISAEERSRIARAFAGQLVERYGVAADVAIHAPHREGDQRNHHAHVLTTTRRLEPDGFAAKTRVLDVAKTGGVEIEEMREDLGRAAERRAGAGGGGRARRSPLAGDAAGRGAVPGRRARGRGAGPRSGGEAGTGGERDRAARRCATAAREGRDYEPVTERGAVVHAARQAREAFAEMRARLELARETYGLAREEGRDRVSAGLAALRAAAGKDRSGEREPDGFRERLERIVGRDGVEPEGDAAEASGAGRGRERLREALGREREAEGADGIGGDAREGGRPSIRERLGEVLNRPRERPAREAGRELERDDGIERERGRDLGEDYGL